MSTSADPDRPAPEPGPGPVSLGLEVLRRDRDAYLLVVAVLAGVVIGMVTALFRFLIGLSHHFFAESVHLEQLGFSAGVTGSVETGVRALLPAFGGFMVGLVVYRLMKIEGGHGVSSVMKALAVGNYHVSSGMAIKAATSIITVTSGGSSGPEGPIVEIASVLSTRLGEMMRLSRDRLGTLIGCGAAAGIAGVFNAPIGGVFLALELLLRDFAVKSFGPIVLAAVTASLTSQAILPNQPVFTKLGPGAIATISASPRQYLMFAVLGVLCGLAAALLVRAIYGMHDLFEKVPVARWLKPAVGGLMVGAIGLFFPTVIGEGYGFVNTSILDHFQVDATAPEFVAAVVLLFVAGVKILATSFTLGSGGTGGAFAPAMVTGAAIGAGFGVVCQRIAPGVAPSPAVLAFCGMAGCVASTLHIPIAAFLIVYEISGTEYKLALPLMVCVSLSSLATTRLRQGSVYTMPLLRSGFDLDRAHASPDALHAIKVGDIMDTDIVRLRPHHDMVKIVEAFSASDDDAFVVVDDAGKLAGLIVVAHLRPVLNLGLPGGALIAADAADSAPKFLFPETSAADAMHQMAEGDLVAMPVIAGPDDRRVVGLISRRELLRAYDEGEGGEV